MYDCLHVNKSDFNKLYRLKDEIVDLWHLYLSVDNTDSINCMDDRIINYDDYCLLYIDFDGISQASSEFSDYDYINDDVECTSEFNHPELDIWARDILDGDLDNYYHHWSLKDLADSMGFAPIDIFVLDSGVDWNHPEFRDDIRCNEYYSTNTEYGSLTCNDMMSLPGTTKIHGSEVASLIFGKRLGILDGSVIHAHSLETCKPGGCDQMYYEEAFSRIIDYVTGTGIFSNQAPTNRRFVINLSCCNPVNFYDGLEYYLRQLNHLGGILVSSAGNANTEIACHAFDENENYMITVGGFRNTVPISSFYLNSNRGTNYGHCVDIYAPGQDVTVAYLAGFYANPNLVKAGYRLISGTSYSAPIITGIVAKLITINGNLGINRIKYLLKTPEFSHTFSNCPEYYEQISDTEYVFHACHAIRIPDCERTLYTVLGINLNCEDTHVPGTLECRDPEYHCQTCTLPANTIGIASDCSDCDVNYVQLRGRSPCRDCFETFSDSCLMCNDDGCQQCLQTESELIFDDFCQKNYCRIKRGFGSTANNKVDESDYRILIDGEFNCPKQCFNNPCHCDEVNYCKPSACHIAGCNQCINGYWKKNYNFHCQPCQETFGNQCLHCADFRGCQQCDRGYDLVKSDECNIWYCKEK